MVVRVVTTIRAGGIGRLAAVMPVFSTVVAVMGLTSIRVAVGVPIIFVCTRPIGALWSGLIQLE